MFTGIQKAIHVTNTKIALSRELDLSPSCILGWVQSGAVGIKYVLRVEALTGVPRHELCPRYYEGYTRDEPIAPLASLDEGRKALKDLVDAGY